MQSPDAGLLFFCYGRERMFSSVRNIHFVGIGGIGMSGIAEILLDQGFQVSGSDMHRSENTEYLASLGATIYEGHAPEHIEGAEVVVYSSAVKPEENPETVEAHRRNIPVIRRAEMLGEVTRLNYCIAVAGTHGKTTTTSMCGLVLMQGGFDPTVIVGGRLKGLGGSNARLGKGEWTVVEADEYDRSFLQLLPTIAVITNVEEDHTDIYEDLGDLINTFTEFANAIPFYGYVALCLDDPGAMELLPKINKPKVTYGLTPQCEVRAVETTYSQRSSTSTVLYNGEEVGVLELHIPGVHNVKNALAAVAVGLKIGIPFESIAAALREFTGVYRRFEIRGERNGVMVVDDYAHHPTEVKATLQATRTGWKNRIVCVFQPHTYTRTRDFASEFGKSFGDADILVVTDVYAAREKPIDGVTGENIADAARQFGHRNVHYVAKREELPAFLDTITRQGDIVLTLGAGDVWKCGAEFLQLS